MAINLDGGANVHQLYNEGIIGGIVFCRQLTVCFHIFLFIFKGTWTMDMHCVGDK
jgi:hypothetical protein